MHIGDPASRGLVDAAPIAFDPPQMAKVFFALYRNYGDVAGIFPVRSRTNLENDLLASRLLEEAVDIVGIAQVSAVYSEDVVSHLHVNPRLSQGGFHTGIPILSVVDLGDAVVSIFEAVVGAEKTAF